jgi:hypothetical protein
MKRQSCGTPAWLIAALNSIVCMASGSGEPAASVGSLEKVSLPTRAGFGKFHVRHERPGVGWKAADPCGSSSGVPCCGTMMLGLCVMVVRCP